MAPGLDQYLTYSQIGKKSFKKTSYQNATICEITKQASSDSMDSKLLKS